MKKLYSIFLIIIFLFGCTTQTQDKPEEIQEQDISETTDILDIGAMDEELDAKALETLEEDLEYISNI